jgi:RNA polymerase sigma factor (TIGR02999 family)
MDADGDVTRLLNEWKEGNELVFSELIPLIYDELRRIAAAHLRRERPDHTLQPTALIHEAYLRLIQGNQPLWHSRVHFFAIASRIMRQILVDAARKHQAEKRPHGPKAELQDAAVPVWERDAALLQLDEAIAALSQVDERKCRVIEMKYYGGLTREEIAEVMGTSEATVGRDLRLAEAWLRRRMGAERR